MARIQHTIRNKLDKPIYVSIEPWPECFELEPDDRLTLIYQPIEIGDALLIDFLNERELVVWANVEDTLTLGFIEDMEFLLNGEPALDKSWKFKHK